MGDECACRARWPGGEGEGKALLESDHVLFRGPRRLKLPFAALARVEARGGDLLLATPDGEVALALGAARAARWAERIRNPRTLLQKLGVAAGQRVSVLRVADEGFLADLAASGADVSARLRKGSDLVLFQADAPGDLARLPRVAAHLAPTGALWVVHPKGRPDFKDVHVLAAGKAAGLVDNKVAGFSGSHSALRFVIPLAKRRCSRDRG